MDEVMEVSGRQFKKLEVKDIEAEGKQYSENNTVR